MTRLLNLLAPYPKGYVPYLGQLKVDFRRAYLRGVILGLIVGFLLGFGASLYWREMQIRESEAFRMGVNQKFRVAESQHSARREALGDEISRRTIAELKLKGNRQ